MDFTYEASGSVSLGGCSVYYYEAFEVALYSINEIVYLKYKAQIGILERICIKDVIYGRKNYKANVGSKKICRLCGFAPTYQDNLNAYYNEEELCGEDEAVELSTAYINQLRAGVERLVVTCGKSAV